MGLILDLAVAILAGLVIVSLALLAWTLAVTCVRAIHVERERVARARATVAEAEARLRSSAAQVSELLAEATVRTTPQIPEGELFDR